MFKALDVPCIPVVLAANETKTLPHASTLWDRASRNCATFAVVSTPNCVFQGY